MGVSVGVIRGWGCSLLCTNSDVGIDCVHSLGLPERKTLFICPLGDLRSIWGSTVCVDLKRVVCEPNDGGSKINHNG